MDALGKAPGALLALEEGQCGRHYKCKGQDCGLECWRLSFTGYRTKPWEDGDHMYAMK